MKKTIKVWFCDPVDTDYWNFISELLLQEYNLLLVSYDPDFIFYSVSGYEHLKYPDACRIFIATENVIPDFNICDFAFGFQRIVFEDRYQRCPNFVFYPRHDFDKIGVFPNKRDIAQLRFCDFIYANATAIPYRDELFRALSRYKFVDAIGKHLRNSELDIGKHFVDEWQFKKIALQHMFKFSITVENNTSKGYTSEKILHALMAGSIPIYYGNPDIELDINPERFINCHRYKSIDDIVARVMEIDDNDTLYGEIVSKPVFVNNTPPREFTKSFFLEKVAYVFELDRSDRIKRSLYARALIYEQQRIRESYSEYFKYLKFLRFRKLRKKLAQIRQAVNKGIGR